MRCSFNSRYINTILLWNNHKKALKVIIILISLISIMPYLNSCRTISITAQNDKERKTISTVETTADETKKETDNKSEESRNKNSTETEKENKYKFNADWLEPNEWYTYNKYDVVKIQNYVVQSASGSGDYAYVYGYCVCQKCHIADMDINFYMNTVRYNSPKAYNYTCPYCNTITTVKIKLEY